MRNLLLTMVILITSGCASVHYDRTKPGELHGKLIVQWIDHDEFIFLPDKDKPLTFTRHNKEKITPGSMYTDGGSIPRPFWVFRSYSPWGYAPAFIVHDWLFEMKHCEYDGHEDYDHEEAAWIMSEVMKTMMLQDESSLPDKFTLYTMFEAVRSPLAKKYWETGKCAPPSEVDIYQRPIKEWVIEYP